MLYCKSGQTRIIEVQRFHHFRIDPHRPGNDTCDWEHDRPSIVDSSVKISCQRWTNRWDQRYYRCLIKSK